MHVIYQSHNRKALRAAEAIARAARNRGMSCDIAPIDGTDVDAIMRIDALVVGCSAEVDTPFGGEATRTTQSWIDEIPDVHGKPCAAFCTYSFFPHTFADVTTRTGEVLERLERALEMKGGNVVASQGFLNRKLDEGAEALVSKLAAYV